jgi:hypothetical protein
MQHPQTPIRTGMIFIAGEHTPGRPEDEGKKMEAEK